MTICNTFFEHENRRLYTWKSPGDRKRNQIDYIMINNRFRNSVKNTKTYPGADVNSDHNPVLCKLHVKLKKIAHRRVQDPQIDASALKQPDLQQKYLVDVRNRYEHLMIECMEQYRRENPEEKIDNKWDSLRKSIQTSNENLPIRKAKNKQTWMTDGILEKMSERKLKIPQNTQL